MEAEKQVQCNFRLPASEVERLASLRERTGVPTGVFLRRLVHRELNRLEPKRRRGSRRASA